MVSGSQWKEVLLVGLASVVLPYEAEAQARAESLPFPGYKPEDYVR